MSRTSVVIRHTALEQFCQNAFERVRVSSPNAYHAAQAIVAANLRGVDSHGITLLPMYIDRIRKGEISSDSEITIEKSEGATMLLNGNNGLGHAVSLEAMRHAIDKAAIYGTSWVGVHESNHFGMAAHYAMKALSHDMIGIVMTVSNINTMAPWNGLDVLLGNNPIAIAVPALHEYPVVYDGAFSIAARRKIHDAYAAKERIPESWALTKDGCPTTDPKEALDGILIPTGGYKGYGLALMISLLAGGLTGAALGTMVRNTNVGHLFGAINIGSFVAPRQMKEMVDATVREMRASRRIPGADAIRVPGERGFITEKQRKETGIPLSAKTHEGLRQLAQELQIEEILT